MLVFGVDIPLVEIIFAFGIIIFVLLAESLILVSLQIRQNTKLKKLAELIEKMSGTLLEIKRAEIDELDKLRRK